MDDDSGNVIGFVIVRVIMLGLVLVAIYLAIISAGITIFIAATFGGGVSLYNYGLAFKNNVKPEKPTI